MKSLWWFWGLNGLITALLGLYFIMRPNFEMSDLLKFFGIYLAVSAASLVYLAFRKTGGTIAKPSWFTLALIFLAAAYFLVFDTAKLVTISNLFLGIVTLAGAGYFGYAAYRDERLRTFNGLITALMVIVGFIFLFFPPRDGSTVTKTLFSSILIITGLYVILVSFKSSLRKTD